MGVRLVIRTSRDGPLPHWQNSFVEIDNVVFSTVILSLLLIQGEGGAVVSFWRNNVHKYWLNA